jgi:hypothetical protein
MRSPTLAHALFLVANQFFDSSASSLFLARNPPSQDYSEGLREQAGAAGYLLAALAAATILSKRLSPRKSSQHGLNLRSPYEGPFGIVVQRSAVADKPSSDSFAKIFSLAGRTRTGL